MWTRPDVLEVKINCDRRFFDDHVTYGVVRDFQSRLIFKICHSTSTISSLQVRAHVILKVCELTQRKTFNHVVIELDCKVAILLYFLMMAPALKNCYYYS